MNASEVSSQLFRYHNHKWVNRAKVKNVGPACGTILFTNHYISIRCGQYLSVGRYCGLVLRYVDGTAA